MISKTKNLFRISLLLLLALSPALTAAAQRPNVLFIAVDDLNDFPSFMQRYPDAHTPHMDRLAKRGTVFTQAHSQFPVCGPARASVMSGLLPVTLGFTGHMKDNTVAKRAEELGTELMHTRFSKNGYKTIAIGKILHSHVPAGSVDLSGKEDVPFKMPVKLKMNWKSNRTFTDWGPVPREDEDMLDHGLAEWAVEQLQSEHERPFLLMVGFHKPHVPWYMPAKWFDLYDKSKLTLPKYRADDLDDVPAMAKRISILDEMPRTDWAIQNDQWHSIVQAYLACVSFSDHQVGKLLDALDASPYKDNTIIVLWSDHGYHMGEKNTFQKQSLWERSSHVPLIISVPGVEGGARCQRVVSLLDLYPTLLELCGLPENPKNQGHSLVPLIQNPDKEWPYPAVSGWVSDSFALQNETHRYIRYGDGSEELYDHRNDLGEFNNLAHSPEHEPVRKAMAQALDRKLKQAREASGQ